jgi:hypothetical protein
MVGNDVGVTRDRRIRAEQCTTTLTVDVGRSEVEGEVTFSAVGDSIATTLREGDGVSRAEEREERDVRRATNKDDHDTTIEREKGGV